MAAKPNEPAFPALKAIGDGIGYRHYLEGGLTKRELFAALVISGMAWDNDDSVEHESTARAAVKYVDALLKALEDGAETAEDLLHEIVRGDSAKGIELELLNRARKLLSKAANK